MKAIYKVPGGKLIKVDCTLTEPLEKIRHIQKLKITGDFFCYPEEQFESIEKNLAGEKFEKQKIMFNIQQTIIKNNLQLIGLSAEDITKTIIMVK